MSDDTLALIMMILSGVIFVGSLTLMVWPRYRRHRAWRRELKGAATQMERGIKENNDADFAAGLERFRQLRASLDREGE